MGMKDVMDVVDVVDVTDEQAAWCVMRRTNRVRNDSLKLATAAVDAFMKHEAKATAARARAEEDAARTIAPHLF